ncbi:DUF6768 family protein [Qipengyuania sp. 902]|uniref:DUF6768 family protein n=1 Tax=Qipengyuania sp. 902 TaxID=3417565 RepID=UPI003EBC5CA0
MTNIDDRIRGALDEDDQAFLENLQEDRGMFRQIGDSMTGPLGGWAKVVFGFAILIGLAMLWVVRNLVLSTEVDQATFWAVVLTATLVVQGFIKEWLFARMNMLTILREIKRLQLQVAMLEERKN